MNTIEIAPGSILQHLYLKERLDQIGIKETFIEFGAGTGYISHLLLLRGYRGIGYDLNNSSCELNKELNKGYIERGYYEVRNENFLNINPEFKYDLIISSMVIEHLNKEEIERYFFNCKKLLSDDGVLISIVPASMDYWNIEDEIAGHYKRYTTNCFEEIGRNFSFYIIRCDGLTFPISNLLFPISNLLVKRAESLKFQLSKQEQTINSSNRKVLMKTNFPPIFNLLLNEITLYPFHLLQKLFKNTKKSMVLYCEMKNILEKAI